MPNTPWPWPTSPKKEDPKEFPFPTGPRPE